MPKYRRKPLVIEAEQFLGSEHPLPYSPLPVCCYDGDVWYIDTMDGDMLLTPGDWVIRGVNGEFYTCKTNIFDKLYELMEDGDE